MGYKPLRRLKKPDDMMSMDLMIPQLDSIALAVKASKDYLAIPIFLMTENAAECQRAHNLDALIHDVISKLFTVTVFCKMVRRITNTGVPDETVH